jgi:outer membrane protein assembly factor BamB
MYLEGGQMKKHLIICCVILLLLSSSFVGVSKQIEIEEESTLNSPPMDSPWPMYCHDARHTGRSPYSTSNNLGIEKWRYTTRGLVWSGSAIDNDGIIYVGGKNLFALYPNGTLKWEYDTPFLISTTPAIDENGIIYVGTRWDSINGDHLYAVYPDGTLKWKFFVGDDICSSPAIGDDGTIYFGSETDYIYALNPDGTLKWKYKTSVAVYSSPAIGPDGTVYCGSHNGNLYAFYPNNGTVKWKYKTGDWVGRGPSIADDGTIYFGSWDGYLHACYPNGTLKWKRGGYLAGTTPITGHDGTIYVGNKDLYAIYPENGTVKWTFKIKENEDIRGSNPCISADGTIYFGTYDGGRIYAVNKDGTEKWHKSIGGDILSAPCIGEDGTVYIADGTDDGRFYAFGPLGSDAPFAPKIDGPTRGLPGIEYDYSFKAISPIGNNVYYWIDWGDGDINGWLGPYKSGEKITLTHTWSTFNKFTIKARAKDTDNRWGPWGELQVTMPRDKTTNNIILLRLLERLPLLQNYYFPYNRTL